MGALARPAVSYPPARALFDALHDLHHRAGWPSLRDLAREVGCSRTTVSAAFSQPRVPRWGLVELLVEALGGDPAEFHLLWLAATGDAPPASTSAAPEPQQPPGAAVTIPHQLPPDVTGFTGRAADLRRLDELRARCNEGGSTMALAVVSGTAGVGKTALAVHWAHRVAAAYPDGQLYLNLRGYDPDRPLTAEEALGQALRAFGVSAGAIPTDVAERAGLLRSLLSERRVLMLLDNAQSVEQVRDLLPGSPSCLVLVTSRDTLPALVARHGATRLNLDLLSAAESLDLLATLVADPAADDRVRADEVGAAALARRCAHLPLALRLAAEMCAARPYDAIADLLVELDSQSDRLDLLDAGDDHTAVRSVFSWSYRELPPPVAAAFRLLGAHPGADLEESAAAALLDVEPARARRLLEALTRAHLIERAACGRFAMHDLLRSYAAELADGLDAEHREHALRRLLEHYLDLARAAVGIVSSAGAQSVAPATRGPAPGPSQWLSWLDTERANLVAAAVRAADVPALSAYALRLAETLAPYLDVGAHYGEAVTLYEAARAAAARGGDQVGEALALNLLGTVLRRRGDYPGALDHHRRALELDRSTGSTSGQARSLHDLGIVLWRSGRYREAREVLHAALDLHRATGDRAAEGAALYSLGIVYRRLGHYAEALEWHHRALEVLREIGDRAGEGRALSNAGVVYIRLGRYTEAAAYIRRALAVQREKGDRVAQSVALTNLGLTCEGLGAYDEALDHLREALLLSRETGYRAGECDARRGLGVVASRLGRHEEAIAELTAALRLGQELGEAEGETGALNELGLALIAAGRPADAVGHHTRALDLAGTSGDGFERARALTGLARAAELCGRDADATAARTEAQLLLQLLGLPDLPCGERAAA